MPSTCPSRRRPRQLLFGTLLLAGGVSLLVLTGAGIAAAATPETAVTVTVQAGNSGAVVGSATLVRSALPNGSEHLQAQLSTSRAGGGDGSHLCLSAVPWQAKADFPSCTYANPSMRQSEFTYSINLGTTWVGKVLNIQLQTRVQKVGSATHTENAYAGWQAHGNTQEGDQYGQVSLQPPRVVPAAAVSPTPATQAGASTAPTPVPMLVPAPAPRQTLSPTHPLLAAAAASAPPVTAHLAVAAAPATTPTLPFTGPAAPVGELVLVALVFLLTGTACLLAGTSGRSAEW